jgi:Flp pilus assembly protein TadD
MIHYNVGVVYMNERGQYEDAIKEFKKAMKIRSNYHIARTSIGHVLIKLGREKEAIAVYEQLVRMGKADKRVFNNLGFLLVDMNIDVQKGIYYLEEIAKKHPRNPSILDSLGWGYYKVGRLREAHDLIRRSLELDDSGESGRDRRKHLREVERALKAEGPREEPPKPVKPLDF